MIKQIIFVMLLLCLIAPIEAELNVTPVFVNSSFIVWHWDNAVTLTALSIDGYTINNADKTSGEFILSDIPPLEMHTIKIYSIDDTGSNTTSTTDASKTSWANIEDLVYIYIWAVFALIALLACIVIGDGYIALIGVLFSFIGYASSVNNSFMQGLIYGIMVVVSILVAFNQG